MLRPALLSLLTINAAYLAWSQGWLAPLGLAPHNPAEPQRVQQQIRSNALHVERPAAAAAPTPVAPAPASAAISAPVSTAQQATPSTAPPPPPSAPPPATTAPPVTAGTTGTTGTAGDSVPAPVAQATPVPPAAPATHTPPPVTAPVMPTTTAPTAPPVTQAAAAALHPGASAPQRPVPQPAPVAQAAQCLQSSPLDADQARALQNALHNYRLPAGSWSLTAVSVPGRWMVYLGPFASAADLEQRRAQLRRQGIEFAPAGGRFEPGLSLGRFSVRDGAVRTLAAVQRQGLRDASLVQERPPTLAYVLRLPAATADMRRQLQQLPPHALGDRPLRPCP